MRQSASASKYRASRPLRTVVDHESIITSDSCDLQYQISSSSLAAENLPVYDTPLALHQSDRRLDQLHSLSHTTDSGYQQLPLGISRHPDALLDVNNFWVDTFALPPAQRKAPSYVIPSLSSDTWAAGFGMNSSSQTRQHAGPYTTVGTAFSDTSHSTRGDAKHQVITASEINDNEYGINDSPTDGSERSMNDFPDLRDRNGSRELLKDPYSSAAKPRCAWPPVTYYTQEEAEKIKQHEIDSRLLAHTTAHHTETATTPIAADRNNHWNKGKKDGSQLFLLRGDSAHPFNDDDVLNKLDHWSPVTAHDEATSMNKIGAISSANAHILSARTSDSANRASISQRSGLMSQYLASLEELRRAENENDEDDTCRSSSPPRTIAQNPEPATLGRAFPLDSAPISDKHHQVSANFTSIEADDYLAAVGKRKVNWVECGNFPYGSDCTTGCANGGEATEFSGHGHESHLNGDCEAALDSSWYRESTRQAGAVHIDSDYRKRLPSLQQAGLVAQQEVLLNKAMYSGRVAAESSPDASNAQDHSAVPLSMRVSFDPGVIHEHSDSALMRTCENWPATAATSSQVRASEFPAARFYAQPVALGRPEHLKSDFETLRRMPLQTTRQSWSHTPPPKPYQIQKTTNGTRDMGISSWHDLDTLSDSSRWQPLPVESGLRDYATVIHEIETRDRARRCMLEGYAAYQLCVARTRAAESNQPLYRSQSFACSRNQESRYARDVTLPHFGRDMICDGITKSAARLSTTRQPAMTQPPVDDLPAKLASMDKPITGLATIQQRQDKAEEARMSGTQPEKASFDKAAAPASGRQDAFLPEQASAAASVHDASHNVTRLTSVTLRRPAWALELTARAARANSVSRS